MSDECTPVRNGCVKSFLLTVNTFSRKQHTAIKPFSVNQNASPNLLLDPVKLGTTKNRHLTHGLALKYLYSMGVLLAKIMFRKQVYTHDPNAHASSRSRTWS